MIYRFQPDSDQSVFSIAVTIALLTALVMTPLRNQFQGLIDRIFYRQRYNAGLMLQRLSEATASLLHLEEITGLILQEVTDTLKIHHSSM